MRIVAALIATLLVTLMVASTALADSKKGPEYVQDQQAWGSESPYGF